MLYVVQYVFVLHGLMMQGACWLTQASINQSSINHQSINHQSSSGKMHICMPCWQSCTALVRQYMYLVRHVIFVIYMYIPRYRIPSCRSDKLAHKLVTATLNVLPCCKTHSWQHAWCLTLHTYMWIAASRHKDKASSPKWCAGMIAQHVCYACHVCCELAGNSWCLNS